MNPSAMPVHHAPFPIVKVEVLFITHMSFPIVQPQSSSSAGRVTYSGIPASGNTSSSFFAPNQPIQLPLLVAASSTAATLPVSALSRTSRKGLGLFPANVAGFSCVWPRGGLRFGGVLTSPDSPLREDVSLFMPGKLPDTVPDEGTRCAALGFPPTAGGAKNDCECRGV